MTNTHKRFRVGNLIALQTLVAGIFAGVMIGQWQTQPPREIQAYILRPVRFQTREAHLQRQSRMVARTMQRTAFADLVAHPAAPVAHFAQRVADIHTHAAASSSTASSTPSENGFPAFVRTVFPVSQTPDWGSMTTPAEWDRTYSQMGPSDFVPIPPYHMAELTRSMEQLSRDRTAANNAIITEKLFYSTRFFGAYDLDSGEFTAIHPGVDLKLAPGTPIGAIAGGRVEQVLHQESDLGLHVIIKHHIDGQTYFSIYGHMSSIAVSVGQDVQPGQTIGTVGTSGFSTAPHIHLQIDRDDGSGPHNVYWPDHIPSPTEAAQHVAHPISFILEHASGN